MKILHTSDWHLGRLLYRRQRDEEFKKFLDWLTVILLHKPDGSPELIVCAVPYLRDRDVRHSEPGESPEAKKQKMVEGIRNHYAEVVNFAEQKRQELAVSIPIIAMGHLFTAGGKTVEGDGVRSLYVGSLAQVSPSLFPDGLDYLALGQGMVGNYLRRRRSDR